MIPVPWKKAVIVPVPKKGDLSLISNYRPISLLEVYLDAPPTANEQW